MENQPASTGRNPQPIVQLDRLTAIPANVWHTFMSSVQDSQVEIAEAVSKAMVEKSLSAYELHEKTGLSCETIQSALDATLDLRDSEPLSKLEQALGIRLNTL